MKSAERGKNSMFTAIAMSRRTFSSLILRVRNAVAGGRDQVLRYPRLSSDVGAILTNQDIKGERAVAFAQCSIALFLLTLHLGARIGKDMSLTNGYVVTALTALALSSLLRFQLTKRTILPERLLDALTLVDIAIFLSLIWSYQYAYYQPAGGILKAPTVVLLFALVVTRALRFHPRPILIAGLGACLGWVLLVAGAVYQDGTGNITRDYYDYLTSYKILIGAEIERVASLAAIVTCLVIGAAGARSLLVRLDSTLENMPQGVAVFDAKMKLTAFNSRYGELYSMRRDELKPGISLKELLGLWRDKGLFGRKNFNGFAKEWIEQAKEGLPRIQKLDDGRVFSITSRHMIGGGLLSTTEDITEQQLIEHLAFHDPLTGLANRRRLSQSLDMLVHGQRAPHSGAVLCLDLDKFKIVNDTLGHQIGDDLLRSVAERLKICVREHDTLARTGGDEFVIVLSAEDPFKASASLAHRIIESIAKPFKLSGNEVMIGTTIGICVFDDDVKDPASLLKNADLALYRAKEEGRGRFRFYESGMDRQMWAVSLLECDLRTALKEDQFEVRFEPIFDLRHGKVSGFQTDLCWQHPERGRIGSDQFLPVAQMIGLCAALGELMIVKACELAAQVSRDVVVTVNLSGKHVSQSELADFIRDTLNDTGAAACQLEIEVGEASVRSESKAMFAGLNTLNGIGVPLAIDGFGVNYYARRYLADCNFSRLKIDPAIVRDVTANKMASGLFSSIVNYAHVNKLGVVAKGIRTKAELEMAQILGCHEMQGEYINAPMGESEALEFVQTSGYRGPGLKPVAIAS